MFRPVKMIHWYEVLEMAKSLHLSSDDNYVLWKFEPKRIYLVSPMYVVINLKGFMPTHVCLFRK